MNYRNLTILGDDAFCTDIGNQFTTQPGCFFDYVPESSVSEATLQMETLQQLNNGGSLGIVAATQPGQLTYTYTVGCPTIYCGYTRWCPPRSDNACWSVICTPYPR